MIRPEHPTLSIVNGGVKLDHLGGAKPDHLV